MNEETGPSLPLQVHESDPEAKRATFGVRYPKAPQPFTHRRDFEAIPPGASGTTAHAVTSRRLSFAEHLIATATGITFRECNFHDRQGKSFARINTITFRDCVFERSFMGTTHYYRVRFRHCRFERCDFGNALFEECLFEDCAFVRCTGDNLLLRATEIDPMAFLAGFKSPQYNFNDTQASEKRMLSREWLDVVLRTAAQLVRGNTELSNSVFIDKGLYALKQAEYELAKDLWLCGTAAIAAEQEHSLVAFLKRPGAGLRLLAKRVAFFLTAGGTQIGRLIAGLLLLAAVWVPLLSWLGVTYQHKPFTLAASGTTQLLSSFATMFPSSLSLLLSFGFGAFEPTIGWSNAALVLGASLGLCWYALLIPVVIRRVYR